MHHCLNTLSDGSGAYRGDDDLPILTETLGNGTTNRTCHATASYLHVCLMAWRTAETYLRLRSSHASRGQRSRLGQHCHAHHSECVALANTDARIRLHLRHCGSQVQ